MKYNDYAIERLQNRLLDLFMKKSTPQKYSVVMFEAVEVIRQLKEQAAPPPNNPLTLEELREMEGEPVWVVPINIPDEKPSWMQVMPGLGIVARHESIAKSKYARFDGYGKDWLAYRRKPEEGAE